MIFSDKTVVEYIRTTYGPMLASVALGFSQDAKGVGLTAAVLAGVMARETKGGLGSGLRYHPDRPLGARIPPLGDQILGDYSRRRNWTLSSSGKIKLNRGHKPTLEYLEPAQYHGYGLFQIDLDAHRGWLERFAPNYQGQSYHLLAREALDSLASPGAEAAGAPTVWAYMNATKAVEILNDFARGWRRILVRYHARHRTQSGAIATLCADRICEGLWRQRLRIVLVMYNSGGQDKYFIDAIRNGTSLDRRTAHRNYSADVLRWGEIYEPPVIGDFPPVMEWLA